MQSVYEDLVLAKIREFNAKEDSIGRGHRLSNKANSKRCIWRRNIYDPKAARRLSPNEIKATVMRLIEMDVVFEAAGRSRGNGLIECPKYDEDKIWSEFT
jgi:hypothetical protein